MAKSEETPTGFTCIQDFNHTNDKGDVLSNYVQGQHYRLRPGNEALFERAKKWEEEGKIRFGAPAARATGSGNVE